MARSLEGVVGTEATPAGCTTALLDPDDPRQVFERGDAQTAAIAAYASVGFEVQERVMRYRKPRRSSACAYAR
jgi:hypothetical protein